MGCCGTQSLKTASTDNRHPRQSPILLSVGHGHLCKQAPAAAASKQKTLVEQSPELLAGKCPALHLGSVGCRALWGLGIQHQLSCGGWEGELEHPGGHEGFEQGRDSPSSPFSKTEASSPVGGCGVHVRRCSCCLESPPVGPTGFRAGDGVLLPRKRKPEPLGKMEARIQREDLLPVTGRNSGFSTEDRPSQGWKGVSGLV